MRITPILNRFFVLAACLAAPASAQEHPARRVANIVSVAVEEYGKGVDAQGRLVSTQEYQEAVDFLVDARRAANRLSGSNATPARALIDSIAAAVAGKRPRGTVDSLASRFAATLGNEAKLELPKGALDLAEGKAIYERSCASCHGATGLGDGAAGRGMSPAPPPIGTLDHMRGVTPALTYRVISVGIAGTPMAGYAGTLTPEQRWNVVAYVTSLRSAHAHQLEGEGLFAQNCASCHGATGAADGVLAKSLSRSPPEIGTVAWQIERSDEQLGEVVREGIPGTAMPPSAEMSPVQVQNVVAYLRTLPSRATAVPSDSKTTQNVTRRIVALLEQSLSA